MRYERGYFTFAGTNSKDFGVYLNGDKTFNSPAREIETISIPGRNGDLVIDKNRYLNVAHTYDAFIIRHFWGNIRELENFLATQVGYQRLEDTYHPDEFYLAVFSSGLDVTPTEDLMVGTFTITFNRKPQRFLKTGEQIQTFTANGSLRNPTRETALPLIRVYGVGTFQIGTATITVTSNPGYIDLDCDTENAYMEATNCNDYIRLDSDSFPKLPAGQTNVVLGSGITKIEIKPRWWRV